MTEKNNLIRIPGIFRVRLFSGDWTNSYSAFSGGQKIVFFFFIPHNKPIFGNNAIHGTISFELNPNKTLDIRKTTID